MAMTEKEKMLAGELYDPSDAELTALRQKAHRLSREFNAVDETDEETRMRILTELLGYVPEHVFLAGPVQFDYGCFTKFGQNVDVNFNFTVLDCAPVTVGNDVFIGPNVSILTPVHPLRRQERDKSDRGDGVMTDREAAKPVIIGDHCWLAGNVTVCGGVTIGEGSVIGAGSVVTRDIPPDTFAAGVPCRPIKKIQQ